ncbi:MAG: hypothetical protein JRF64_11080 [Deltaproteobacteria bacterium]|nr:hypothetical protein [Deltaproteobacteria bacterium]
MDGVISEKSDMDRSTPLQSHPAGCFNNKYYISFFKDPSQIRMAFQDIHRNLAGIYPINVILRSSQEGYFTSSQVLRDVEAFQERLAAIEGVDLAISIVDLLKFEGLFTRGFRDKEKYYVVPDDPFAVREAIKNYRLFEASELVDHFVSNDFSAINIVCRSHIASTADFILAEKKILSYLRDHFPDDIESDVTGLSIVGSHSAQALTKGQIRSLGLALVCVFVLLSVLFFSPKVGLLAMIPNLFPILVNFGMMGWLGIQLTVATSLVASIAIGLAVDDSIHYMFRFNHADRLDFRGHRAWFFRAPLLKFCPYQRFWITHDSHYGVGFVWRPLYPAGDHASHAMAPRGHGKRHRLLSKDSTL